MKKRNLFLCTLSAAMLLSSTAYADVKEATEVVPAVVTAATEETVPAQVLTPAEEVAPLIAEKEETTPLITPQEEETEAKTFTYTVKALEKDGTAYIPLREAAEKLGCTITWDKTTRTAQLSSEMRKMNIAAGQTVYTSTPVDEEMLGMPTPKTLGAAFLNEEGSLYVPADVFSVLVGYDVAVKDGSVSISSVK